MTSQYDYSNVNDFEKSQLPDGFQGNVYNLSYKWKTIIPESSDPMKIIELYAKTSLNVFK